MRFVVWLVLLAAAAVLAAAVLGANEGLVTFYRGVWRLDMSLNLFLVLALGVCFLVVTLMQGVRALVGLPQRAKQWRTARRERLAQVALREALAVMQAEKERVVQQALAAGAQEIAQLKATVSALRDALEAARQEHEQALQAAGREQQDENRHLLQTVVMLREQLDLARAPQPRALPA